jgi:hypothetical protein
MPESCPKMNHRSNVERKIDGFKTGAGTPGHVWQERANGLWVRITCLSALLLMGVIRPAQGKSAGIVAGSACEPQVLKIDNFN